MTDASASPRHRFEALYRANSRALLGYALRRCRQPGDAADVVAETFLVAWRRIDDVPPGSESRLWLFGVARNVMANHRRGTLRRSNLADRLRSELSGLPVPDISTATEDARIVHAAMAALDPDDRELLWLTCWEGFKPTEIASMDDTPAATVRTRLHRARGRLRRALLDLGFHDERCGPGGHEPTDERPLVQDPGGER